MKDKMTMKEVKRMFKNIISVGYCDLWYMLHYTNRIGHTEGVYGWNADIYKLDNNTCIVTGYRPFRKYTCKLHRNNKKI